MAPSFVFPSEEGMEESCVANRVPTICHANGALWHGKWFVMVCEKI